MERKRLLNIMSATLANPEDNVAQPAKLFGLPRPLAGALIGILIFLYNCRNFSFNKFIHGFHHPNFSRDLNRVDDDSK